VCQYTCTPIEQSTKQKQRDVHANTNLTEEQAAWWSRANQVKKQKVNEGQGSRTLSPPSKCIETNTFAHTSTYAPAPAQAQAKNDPIRTEVDYYKFHGQVEDNRRINGAPQPPQKKLLISGTHVERCTPTDCKENCPRRRRRRSVEWDVGKLQGKWGQRVSRGWERDREQIERNDQISPSPYKKKPKMIRLL